MHLSPYRYEAYEGLVNCYIAMHRLREALTVASGVCKQLGQNPRTLTVVNFFFQFIIQFRN